jgi:hypothetical protein
MERRPASYHTTLSQLLILPGGRGSWLACDLARSGSKSSGCGMSGKARVAGFAAASRQIVSKRSAARLTPTPFGQKYRTRF